jgi:hypothetical protein
MILLATTYISTESIEKVLKELKVEYVIYNGKNEQVPSDLSKFSVVINLDSEYHFKHSKIIHLIAGTWNYEKFQDSIFNIFCSEEIFKESIKHGYVADYSRDLIITNDYARFFACLPDISEAA